MKRMTGPKCSDDPVKENDCAQPCVDSELLPCLPSLLFCQETCFCLAAIHLQFCPRTSHHFQIEGDKSSQKAIDRVSHTEQSTEAALHIHVM